MGGQSPSSSLNQAVPNSISDPKVPSQPLISSSANSEDTKSKAEQAFQSISLLAEKVQGMLNQHGANRQGTSPGIPPPDGAEPLGIPPPPPAPPTQFQGIPPVGVPPVGVPAPPPRNIQQPLHVSVPKINALSDPSELYSPTSATSGNGSVDPGVLYSPTSATAPDEHSPFTSQMTPEPQATRGQDAISDIFMKELKNGASIATSVPEIPGAGTEYPSAPMTSQAGSHEGAVEQNMEAPQLSTTGPPPPMTDDIWRIAAQVISQLRKEPEPEQTQEPHIPNEPG